jgi:hypothetical protein
MGREKEERIVREDRARMRARDEGKVCGACAAPLLRAEERARGICDRCQATMDKDD